MVGADVLGGPRPRDVPMRAAWTSPARGMDVPMRAARRGRRALPAGASRPPVGAARAHGGQGDICGRGRRPRRPASLGRPRARGMDVPCARHGRPLRAARTSPCARRAEDVAPYQPAHPVPLCRETLCPPGRCDHERTAARCAILFGLRGTDERGRVPVRGVHHGTAKRRKPKRPCV